MRTIGYGIIGCGMISEIHAKALSEIEGAKLIAGFDPVPGKAKAFGEKFGCLGYENFDEFLAEYGYVREGNHYRVVKESEETVTFFCHFGLTCVLLSRLWNVSPFVLWHGLVMAPTSVTEVVSEEREQGIAYFRGLKIGDVSHLIMGGEEPSFAARFCEVYSNTEQRH